MHGGLFSVGKMFSLYSWLALANTVAHRGSSHGSKASQVSLIDRKPWAVAIWLNCEKKLWLALFKWCRQEVHLLQLSKSPSVFFFPFFNEPVIAKLFPRWILEINPTNSGKIHQASQITLLCVLWQELRGKISAFTYSEFETKRTSSVTSKRQKKKKKVEGSIGKDVICWTSPVPRPQERRRDVIKSIKATVTGRKSDCLPHMLTCHVSSSNGRAACREWNPSAASSQGTGQSGEACVFKKITRRDHKLRRRHRGRRKEKTEIKRVVTAWPAHQRPTLRFRNHF